MADKTGIEWTDTTWNPIRGCTRVSEGCRNCYAEKVAARFSGPGLPYEGLAVVRNGHARWTGEVRLVSEHLEDPVRWRKPRRIFVNSMSDLFHEKLSNEQIATVFKMICKSLRDRPREQRHTFQILTKRAERLPDWFAWAQREYAGWFGSDGNLDLGHVWLGVSVEDQQAADERIPLLLQTPVRVRWLSCEPLLGPVDLGLQGATCSCCPRWPSRWVQLEHYVTADHPLCLWPEHREKIVAPGIYRAESNPHGALSVPTRGGKLGVRPDEFTPLPGVDWVVVGGESGPDARPMHPDWARSLRDQCQVAGVPYFFKQWGEWKPISEMAVGEDDALYEPAPEGYEDLYTRQCKVPNRAVQFDGGDGYQLIDGHGGYLMFRVGKKKAGRTLDGRTWDEYPEAR